MAATNVERCISCRTAITNVQGTVKFSCPGCSKTEIIRCEKCRRFAARYSCPECNFEGPN